MLRACAQLRALVLLPAAHLCRLLLSRLLLLLVLWWVAAGLLLRCSLRRAMPLFFGGGVEGCLRRWGVCRVG